MSLCAHIYSIEYMSTDPHNIRFFAYLSLFTFFMVILVISDNAIQLFVGWEGVGICSYLLINFWYTRIQANKASILAVITNKVGDIALLVGIAVSYGSYHTVDFAVLNACATACDCTDTDVLVDMPCYCLCIGTSDCSLYGILDNDYVLPTYDPFTYVIHGETALNSACLLLMIAAIGKSAQAGLHI